MEVDHSVNACRDLSVHRRRHVHRLPAVSNVWLAYSRVNDRLNRSPSAVYDYEKPCARGALWFGESEILGSWDSSVESVHVLVCLRLWWSRLTDRHHFHREISVDREVTRPARSPTTKRRYSMCSRSHRRLTPGRDSNASKYTRHSVHLWSIVLHWKCSDREFHSVFFLFLFTFRNRIVSILRFPDRARDFVAWYLDDKCRMNECKPAREIIGTCITKRTNPAREKMEQEWGSTLT